MTTLGQRRPDPAPAPPRPLWRRIFHWPLFCALAALHLLVLPLVLPEREDAVLAAGAGAVYLALALADWWTTRRRPVT